MENVTTSESMRGTEGSDTEIETRQSMTGAEEHDIEMATARPVQDPPPQAGAPAEAAGAGWAGWAGKKRGALLVVVTLITTLTYQVATNVPGGYWQDDKVLHKKGDPMPDHPGLFWNATVYKHRAGEPILCDKDPARYWILRAGNWIGFLVSMSLTMSLLLGAPVSSRLIRWGFPISYTCVLLSYLISDPTLPWPLVLGICAYLVASPIVMPFFLSFGTSTQEA